MQLTRRLINFFAGIVILICTASIILNINKDSFVTNYRVQISIILAALGIISFQQHVKYKWLSNRHYVLDHKIFIDRKKQIKELLDILKEGNNIVNIFGIDGIGVSETLRFFADLINKQLPLKRRLDYYKSLKTLLPTKNIAFYFKITNVCCKDQLIKEIYENMFISSQKEDVNITELITLINKKSGKKRLVIMFDEIESTLQMSMIEEFILLYLQFRPQDTFFIGSHKKNLSYQLTCHFIEILKFNKDELYILAKAYNVSLKDNEYTKLFELSQGIPVYAYLLLRYYYIENQLCKDNLIEYLRERILNQLDEREQEIICKIALLSKQPLEINYNSLSQSISNFTLSEMMALENKALLDINKKENTLSMLPIIADQVILHLNNIEFATKLFRYYQKRENDTLAIMYLLLGEIKKKDVYYFNKTIEQYLEHNDMLSLYNALILSVDLEIDVYNKYPEIYKKYILACITMLLSCGEYKKAEKLFKEFTFNTSYFITLKHPANEEQFHFYFLWADTKHLLNCYSEAINIIDELITCEHSNEEHLCQLYWMKAHCLRHQWKDYSESLAYYKLCNNLSNDICNTEYIIRSLHGLICIAFISFEKNFDFKNTFKELDAIYEKTGDKWNLYKYNTLKYKSIYNRIMERNKVEAEKLLNEALEGYINIKRRNIYDVYFEFGELHRFFGENEQAQIFYSKCLEYSQNNSDYNLQSLAQMGSILSSISLDKKLDKASLTQELQLISLNAETKELFLNKHYSKLLIEKINNSDNTIHNILLFNP